MIWTAKSMPFPMVLIPSFYLYSLLIDMKTDEKGLGL